MFVRILYFIGILYMLSFPTACAETQPSENKIETFVDKHGWLSVKGTSLIDENGKILVMKGVSLGWHNWWSQFYNESTITWLQNDWGCNLVRAAIGVEPDGAYTDNPSLANKCLDNVVDATIKNGMYVIIDWHSHNVRMEEAKEFFMRVANKYKDYPNIIYEIFNEPERISWQEVKSYSEELIKTIRAIDQRNIILVGTPHWDQDIHLAADNPIIGYDNIMYTLHFYAATHKQELRTRAGYALQKGLPIFVSECAGMEATGDRPINHQEWNNWVEWMAKNNFTWVAWSVSGKNETCSMIKDDSSPVSGWAENDLKEWGMLVKGLLKE
ncbi:glycoside hydrolase family 5 protein [Dysgonomonas reticulitermitis]